MKWICFELRKETKQTMQAEHELCKLYIFYIERESGVLVCVYVLARIGASGVRALPLAAGINVGGHYKWHFFLLLFPAHC